MKGTITWPETLRAHARLTKRQLSDMGLSLLKSVAAKVAGSVGAEALQLTTSVLRLLPKNHMLTAEEQILAAKRNIVLLVFFTITLGLLYTWIVMQGIK